MPHRRNQHDYKAPVDLAAQEADRRRRMALATPVLIAAKTIAINILLPLQFLLGLAAGLTPILGPVQFTRAVETSALMNRFG